MGWNIKAGQKAPEESPQLGKQRDTAERNEAT